MQTIWFFIAFKKRHEIDKQDKRATLMKLRHKMTIYTDLLTSIIITGTVTNKIALPNSNNINIMNISNEGSKTKSNISANKNNSLKSKRMMYNLYNLEHRAVIRIHSNKDDSNEANKKQSLVEQPNENNVESEDDPKLSTMESSYTSMCANSDIDRINSLLIIKKNSNCLADAQHCNSICINMPE